MVTEIATSSFYPAYLMYTGYQVPDTKIHTPKNVCLTKTNFWQRR